ncbi:MAG: primase-helicase family protein, partial [Burkholderiales bacterium]
GHEYVAQRRMSELEDRYNGWIEKAQFAFIDEVGISQLRQSQKVMSDLKNLITEPTVTVRQMYRGAYPAANFTNFLLASNMSKPVTIDISDRRFNVGDYQPRRLNMNSDQMAQMWAELPQFVDYLMTREADEDKARMVLETLERQKLISRSRTSVDMVADALLEGDLPFFWDSISDSVDAMTVSSVYANAYKLLIEDLVVHFNPAGKLTRRELITIFEHCIGDMPKSPNRFTSMLRHHRVDLCKVRTSEGTVTGMYVNWRATDEWLAGRRAEIAARRAPSKVGSVKKAALAVVKA